MKINNHVKNRMVKNFWLGKQQNSPELGGYGQLGYGLELKMYSPKPRYEMHYDEIAYVCHIYDQTDI